MFILVAGTITGMKRADRCHDLSVGANVVTATTFMDTKHDVGNMRYGYLRYVSLPRLDVFCFIISYSFLLINGSEGHARNLIPGNQQCAAAIHANRVILARVGGSLEDKVRHQAETYQSPACEQITRS